MKSMLMVVAVVPAILAMQEAKADEILNLKKLNALQQAQIEAQGKEVQVLKLLVAQIQEQLNRRNVVVFNSIANTNGTSASGDANTMAFWNISYADRLKMKGLNTPHTNFYNPAAYSDRPATFIDEIEDLSGKTVVAFVADADGFDDKTMRFRNPRLVSGNGNIYSSQFAAGWAATDYDGDTYEAGNCAVNYLGVAQHYSLCWTYNLGVDADEDKGDAMWGPHLQSETATSLGLSSDGSRYTRVRRITRYVQLK